MGMVSTTSRTTGEPQDIYVYSFHRQVIIVASTRVKDYEGNLEWKAYVHIVPRDCESHDKEAETAYHRADGMQLPEHHARHFFDFQPFKALPYAR